MAEVTLWTPSALSVKGTTETSGEFAIFEVVKPSRTRDGETAKRSFTPAIFSLCDLVVASEKSGAQGEEMLTQRSTSELTKSGKDQSTFTLTAVGGFGRAKLAALAERTMGLLART